MKRLAALAVLMLAGMSSAFADSDEDERREKQKEVRGLKGRVIESQGCPAGTFTIVTSPDGGAISVLFDKFAVEGTPANGGFARMTCGIEIPLHLPAGFSLGVYQVDYRGFAHLEDKQRGELSVNYGIGSGERNRGKRFHGDVKGVYDGDFAFNERLKGGVLKRMGCGDEAVLNFAATLTVVSKRGANTGSMTLDSVDGAPAGGLTFGLDLKKCGGGGR
jgi:hypothetical protein